MNIGLKASVTTTVTHSNCACAMGSGSLDVFATPSMVALMEQAACTAITGSLEEGESTVGTLISTAHLKASPLGETITATATLTAVEGRKLLFKVEASDTRGIIGEGTHERFCINIEKFLSKLK